jgi:hypothetical protein
MQVVVIALSAYGHVLAELLGRPKMGFAFPRCEWLPGALRD